MSIGYACITVGISNTDMKYCTMKYASEDRLKEVISSNLSSLKNIIKYNIDNNIKLFRISSGLIPFASSAVNPLDWQVLFACELDQIGQLIKDNNIRVSMHAGHYTVINSPNEEVVKNSAADLLYHVRVLKSLGCDESHKIILHVGGLYNDKATSIVRFIDNFNKLDADIKKRIVIENDDKSFNIADVLGISEIANIPVVYDNLHNKVLCYDNTKSDDYWIEKCRKTWRASDGKQKVHYSQQEKDKKIGSHSNSVEIDEFIKFYENLSDKNIDIMLEVKDKNLSAVKCINCVCKLSIENEWAKYKYTILEKSPHDYYIMGELAKKNKQVDFYRKLYEILQKPCQLENRILAAKKIWNDFENTVFKEEETFLAYISKLKKGKITANQFKGLLKRVAVKYDKTNLLNSYYFTL